MNKPTQERRGIHLEGGCLIFAWGPPWSWLPKVQRSKHSNGVSLIWLWWGLYYVQRSVGTLLVYSELYRRQGPIRENAARLKALLRRAANYLESANEIIIADGGDEDDFADTEALIAEMRQASGTAAGAGQEEAVS